MGECDTITKTKTKKEPVTLPDTGLSREDGSITQITYNQCPECQTHNSSFEYDITRDEIVCTGCGLVLSGPPCYVAGHTPVSYPFENKYCHTVGGFHNYYASYTSLYLSGRGVLDRRHLDYNPIR